MILPAITPKYFSIQFLSGKTNSKNSNKHKKLTTNKSTKKLHSLQMVQATRAITNKLPVMARCQKLLMII